MSDVGQPERKTQNRVVKLLGINDFHGQIEAGKTVSGRPVGGAAVLASYLKAAQAGIEDQTILVRHVLTHAEYDKGDWKK